MCVCSESTPNSVFSPQSPLSLSLFSTVEQYSQQTSVPDGVRAQCFHLLQQFAAGYVSLFQTNLKS